MKERNRPDKLSETAGLREAVDSDKAAWPGRPASPGRTEQSGRPAARRRQIFGFSPWLLAGVSAVLGLAVILLALRSNEREREHVLRNFFDRADALIWALEAGARTTMGPRGGELWSIQPLLEETARQPGIAYMALLSPQGRILAHSDRNMIGGRIDIRRLPAGLSVDSVSSRLAVRGEGPTSVISPAGVSGPAGQEASGLLEEHVFEVYRLFVPLRPQPAQGHMGHAPRGRTQPYMSGNTGNADNAPGSTFGHSSGHAPAYGGAAAPLRPSRAAALLREEARAIAVVGFDKQPFDMAVASDRRYTVLAAGSIAALGLAGFFSLFWAHSYRTSRRKLKDSQALAAEVVTSLPVGLVTSRPDGTINMINAAALEMFHCTREDVSGRHVRDLSGLDWGALLARLEHQEKLLEHDMELRQPRSVETPPGTAPAGEHDDACSPVSVSASHIRDEDGYFLGLLFILRDTGEVRRLQREVQRSERLRALGGLAAGVAHEIRNPLSSIKGLATFLLRKTQAGGAEEEAARTMVAEVDRLNRVVSGLLEFARPSAVKLEETDPVACVEHAARLCRADREANAVQLDWQPPGAGELPPGACLNPERLTQALLNLFLNAIQAMPGGGVLTVRVEARPGDMLAFTVADTGRGITAEALASIFTPYYTDKVNGTGLGLAIVQQVAEAHGGRVLVQSQAGAGSLFTLLLPRNGPQGAGGYTDD